MMSMTDKILACFTDLVKVEFGQNIDNLIATLKNVIRGAQAPRRAKTGAG
jgi:hypothetical protein